MKRQKKTAAEQTRYMREYQAKRRGSTSFKSIAEDASVVVAFALGLISEGRACKTIGTDRLSFREKLDDMAKAGCQLANVLRSYDDRLEKFEISVGVGVESE